MSDIPPEIEKMWAKGRLASKAINDIREVLSETTVDGCFGGLAHPGMDYSDAMEQIIKIVHDYRLDSAEG
jgi:hypothetical protein